MACMLHLCRHARSNLSNPLYLQAAVALLVCVRGADCQAAVEALEGAASDPRDCLLQLDAPAWGDDIDGFQVGSESSLGNGGCDAGGSG
jgi:hypothetical protein